MTDLQRVTRQDERPAAARRPAVARVGIVGCGVISRHYARNASAFSSFEVVACADLDPSPAERPPARAVVQMLERVDEVG
jgi:phosphoglycerate dehydrogenase-like enzyme